MSSACSTRNAERGDQTRMLKNRRDQARLDYLQTRAAEFRARAEQATEPRERAKNLTAARRFDHMYRTERTFPIGVWLFWARGTRSTGSPTPPGRWSRWPACPECWNWTPNAGWSG